MTFNPMKHRIPTLKRLVPSLRKRLSCMTWRNEFAHPTALFSCSTAKILSIGRSRTTEISRENYLFEQMKARGCDLFVDIGANIGLHAIQVAFSPASDTSTGRSRVDESGRGIAVPCVSLDDAVTGSGRRIFIKMNIEGHELAAIQGMKACVKRNRVFL